MVISLAANIFALTISYDPTMEHIDGPSIKLQRAWEEDQSSIGCSRTSPCTAPCSLAERTAEMRHWVLCADYTSSPAGGVSLSWIMTR